MVRLKGGSCRHEEFTVGALPRDVCEGKAEKRLTSAAPAVLPCSYGLASVEAVKQTCSLAARLTRWTGYK